MTRRQAYEASVFVALAVVAIWLLVEDVIAYMRYLYG